MGRDCLTTNLHAKIRNTIVAYEAAGVVSSAYSKIWFGVLCTRAVIDVYLKWSF